MARFCWAMGKATLGAFVAVAVAASGCAADKGAAAATTTVSEDDVFNTDDLLVAEASGSGAAKVGDPATLLKVARDAVDKSRSHVKAVADLIKEIAANKKPTATGTTIVGKLPYGKWTGTKNGVDLTLWVIRTAENRLRYVLYGKKGSDPAKALLTGVFIKKAPRVGGGRLHVSLTNTTALFGAPGKTGSMHVWFANHKSDAKGRRIAYFNVKDVADPQGVAANYAADAIYRPGAGGRLRQIYVADIDPKQQGLELFALRVLWKIGTGGRADAIYANVTAQKTTKLADAHECWGADGNRTAYSSNPADPNNAKEGDTSSCFAFAQETVPETVATTSGADPDPELDTMLADSGAAGIDSADADKTDGAQ
ncbi:MAG: hypothetical protein FJ100_15240 [Deltaproteobacteria bacterium]|nr:hypothetical protein [Deltaproteobacteria bacterium]